MFFKKECHTARLAVAVLALGVLAACGSDPAPAQNTNARAEIQVSLTQALAAVDVTRVRVEASGPGISVPLSVDLMRAGNTWQGTLSDIPAGADRRFVATAFDAQGAVLYRGEAGPLVVDAGATLSVSIVLQQVNPPTPFENAAPVIESLVVSANVVHPSGTVTLTATARDDNPGDVLSYQWSASAGSFSAQGPATQSTTWTAPATEGVHQLMLTVMDSRGATATVSVNITVQRNSGSVGGASVTVTFNSWPYIQTMTAAPSILVLNAATRLSVIARDEDGDAISQMWSTDCNGTFDNAAAISPLFTLRQVPASGRCTFNIQVSDGRGGQNTGALILRQGNLVQANVAPRLVSISQSTSQAGPGELVTLGVAAQDPEGSSLNITWFANQGTLRSVREVPGSGSSEVDWKAPACVTGLASITAVVSDGSGAVTRHDFYVTARLGTACGGQTVAGVQRLYRVQPDGAVFQLPSDLSTATIGAWVPTGTGTFEYRPGVGLDDGSFAIPGVDRVPYLLRYNSGYVWTSQREVDLSRAELGRYDVESEAADRQFQLELSGFAPWQANDDFQLTAMGAGVGYFSSTSCARPSLEWTEGDVTAPSTPFEYSNSILGCGNTRAGRIDLGRGDVVYATQLVGRSMPESGLDSVQEVRRAVHAGGPAAGALLSQEGSLLRMSGALAPLPTNLQAFSVNLGAFESMALSSHPTAQFSNSVVNMGVLPGLDQFGTYAGWPDLAIGFNYTPGLSVINPVFEYANPFPNTWRRFVTATTTARVRYAMPLPGGGTAQGAWFNLLSYAQEPLVEGGVHLLFPQVAPARNLRLNGQDATGPVLTGVGLSPVVSWDAPGFGVPTSYAVRIYRLSAPTNITRRTQVASLLTDQTQVPVPPGVLAAGESYYVQLTAIVDMGYNPNTPYLSHAHNYSAASATSIFQP
ncbi:PKD domain-containing protein [Myxococcaceae bacterium GXIMD 01537]